MGRPAVGDVSGFNAAENYPRFQCDSEKSRGIIKARKKRKAEAVNVKMDGNGETLLGEYAAVTQAFVNAYFSWCVSNGEMDAVEDLKKCLHENLNIAFKAAERQKGETWSHS